MTIKRYIAFLLGLVVVTGSLVLLGGTTVFFFDRFKIRTAQENLKIGHGEYVPSLRVDDTVIAIALANMRLGNRQSHVMIDQKNTNTFRIMNEQRALLSVNIMELLSQDQGDTKQLLTQHIRHLELVRDKTVSAVSMLQERAQLLFEESQNCLSSKQGGDQRFFAGVELWSDTEAKAGLTQSLESAPCYITKRIEANASNYLAGYVGAALPLLERRINILTTNQDNLVMYKGLFEGNILDDLQTIKQQVNSIAASPTDMEQIFNFWQFNQTTSLPTFNSVWFPGGKIPTFNDPGIRIKTAGF